MCGKHLFISVPILAKKILNKFTLEILQEIVPVYLNSAVASKSFVPILFAELYSFSLIWYLKALYIPYS